MPTVFFLKARNPQTFNYQEIIRHIHINDIKPPLLAIFKVSPNPTFAGIRIYLPHVYLFSSEVDTIAFKILKDYLNEIGLANIFEEKISHNTTPVPYSPDEMSTPLEAIPKSKPNFTITLMSKVRGLELYSQNNEIIADIDKIIYKIKFILKNPTLKIDLEYNEMLGEYHLHFIDYRVEKQKLTFFQGEVILLAIRLAGFTDTYIIKDFDEATYQKILNERIAATNSNIKPSNLVLPKVKTKEEQELDNYLYGTSESQEKQVIEIKKEALKVGSVGDLTKSLATVIIDPTLSPEQQLLQAIANNSPDIKKYITQVTDINFKDPITEQTFLHKAVILKQQRAIAELIKAGADRELTDHLGKTPADYASDEKIKRLFVLADTKPSLVNKK